MTESQGRDAERRKADLIDQVAARVRELRPAGQAADAERFARVFYCNVAPDDILDAPAENLASAAMSLWDFAQERRAGTAKIRVYNTRGGEEGWRSSHTIVEVVNDDMPFLVDSVTADLVRRDAEVHLVIHPIVGVGRDESGRLAALYEAGHDAPGGLRESCMHLQISEQAEAQHEAIRDGLAAVLADVRKAVEDWRPIRERLREIVAGLQASPPPLPQAEVEQGIEFLRWLDQDSFTFLGYREYAFSGDGEAAVARVQENGLGLLRDQDFAVFDGLRNLGTLPEDVRQFVRRPELLSISKSNRPSPVHRPVPLDTVVVKSFDAQGNVTGERLFIGLFTSHVYSRSARLIPLLRTKVENVVARAGFAADSHDGKALLHILETYPRDELFQTSEEELSRIAIGILHLQERQRVALFTRRDPYERYVSCLVFVPRDRYDTKLRRRFQEILTAAYQGTVTAFYINLTDEPLARLHFLIATTRGLVPTVDVREVEEQLIAASRSWLDRASRALTEAHGEGVAARLTRRYGQAFQVSYQDRFDEQAALFDIERLEEAIESGDLALNLYRPAGLAADQARFKVYSCGQSVPLSNVLPMLENLGLEVIDEIPYEVRPQDLAQSCSIRDFEVKTKDGAEIDLGSVRVAFQDAFRSIFRGEMEDDGFNRLVLSAGLVARQVTVLRAYCKYLRQAQIPFSQTYMEQTLAHNPEITCRLVELFAVRFDPAAQEGAEARAAALVAEIEQRLDKVSNLDEDRIIRRFLNLVESTLRTNFYKNGDDGQPMPYLSLKLDSQSLDELPKPRPFREVFVYSPRVEAVHLRGGKVARGGIRWSDRPEDFRTEVLGLMKAQMVKNAVIVPVGSKGGFVVRRPPAGGREKLMDEVVDCYKTLMRGLLDLTDNLVGSGVVPPPAVVRRDGDDPYLVVAADKGTATFSDIANGIAADYGFWLDDAFASGGSVGYDHKKMAITSRGVWESVKRHFREMGKDVQTQDFTVVGVGDMAGDVFGNGMLMSEHIRLLAAFNHMHIFIDPDPDPAVSVAERRRLFDKPRSTWADYDAALISAGGGIFERSQKSIPLSTEMKRLSGLTAEHATPADLIRSLLKADVELLWFGGIGTYVKARSESHADAGDRANDALRLDGADLRAKVIGEGANLGMTQRARVEYGLRGGRLNTDFIDNSAGVDCSDHEVNIKILLGDVERAGTIGREQRNEILKSMTDEVAHLVLRDNYLQTQAITITHRFGAHLLDRIARYMRALEKAGVLDRQIEFLPDEEGLIDRAKEGAGFTRPEIAVLLSYSKIALYDELVASGLPDDPYMQEDLRLYFPTPLRERFAEAISRHRLRREIIATAVTNSMVNRVGIPFIHETKEKTGLTAEDIARAYVISREIFGVRDLWSEVEGLDNRVPAEIQATMLVECGRLIEHSALWFLRERPHPLDIGAEIQSFAASVREIADGLEGMLPESHLANLDELTQRGTQGGAPQSLARRISSLHLLTPALAIARLAKTVDLPVAQVGKVYYGVGSRFGFDWLRLTAGKLPRDNAWDKQAISAIVDDLFGHQSDLTARVLTVARSGAAESLIESWAEARRPLVTRTDQLLAELRSVATPNLAMLAVANRQLKSMGS